MKFPEITQQITKILDEIPYFKVNYSITLSDLAAKLSIPQEKISIGTQERIKAYSKIR